MSEKPKKPSKSKKGLRPCPLWFEHAAAPTISGHKKICRSNWAQIDGDLWVSPCGKMEEYPDTCDCPKCTQ